jgi:hypothetical protein
MTEEVEGKDTEFFERKAPCLRVRRSPGEMVAPGPRSINKLESDNQLHCPLWFWACIQKTVSHIDRLSSMRTR